MWVYQVNSLQKLEATPLVADGIMYISEPPSNVTALDTRTGRPLWRYRRVYPEDIRVCCGEVNRGVAILGDLIYVGTVDAHIVALDAKTGAVRWDTAVANHKSGYSITVAPLAMKDKIVIGMAGGEYGVRGFLDAYDAKTGKRAWRFWTVPGEGEPGNETWAGDTWKTGSPQRGLPAHTIPIPIWFIGAPEIPDPTRMAIIAAEPIFTPIVRCARCRYRNAEMVLPVHAA